MFELVDVSKNFGGVQAIRHLSFKVEKGEIVSLIGPNGAGKTTVLNLITGLYPLSEGDIQFKGRSILGLQPHQVTRLGIARTFQNLRLFLNMSIIDNVMSAAFPRTHANLAQIIFRTPAFRREEREIRQRAEERLAFFGERLVGYRFDQNAYSLSYANRRRLEIARALMTQPEFLLLDEPAAGMNPNESAEVTELIGKLRDELGLTIILIEHDMGVVGKISDRVIALDYGEKIAEGSYEEVATSERVIEAYLGRNRDFHTKTREFAPLAEIIEEIDNQES
jgi:branched-chain amino acid transport system ATP-binding protein